MPSAFTHAFSAIALGSAFKKIDGARMVIIGAICSALPDADALSFQFGVPYSSMWGHRGITHSFFFAALLAIFIVFIFYGKVKSGRQRTILFIYFFLATALHPLLDALTSGGLGVAFFAPFDNSRYFFPWRPIMVSPISISGFFNSHGWAVFKNELLWVWMPSAIFMIVMRVKNR